MESKEKALALDLAGDPPGIVVLDHAEPPRRPLISAFVWGAPVAPVPTLPFGRWKAAAV